MLLKEWLELKRGRQSALATHLGVHKTMVSQMASGAVRIPPRLYLSIRDFTAGDVSIEDMLPAQEPIKSAA